MAGKRKTTSSPKTRLKWDDEEVEKLISYWGDNYATYKTNRILFIRSFSKFHAVSNDETRVKNKLEYLVKKYTEIHDSYVFQSGFGCEENDPPSVKDAILQKFEYF